MHWPTKLKCKNNSIPSFPYYAEKNTSYQENWRFSFGLLSGSIWDGDATISVIHSITD